jgi:hypothetical protein
MLVLALLLGGLPSSAQTSDTTAPLLGALSFSSSVDVSSAAQSVVINATITDDLAGVAGGSIEFIGPNNQQSGFAGFVRLAGTALNGTYRATVTIPRFAQPGIWKATVFLSDLAGNNRSLPAGTLQSLGFPTDLTVADTSPDSQPPTLTSASFSPSSIDVSSLDVDVTISLQVTDNLSGATFSPATGGCLFAVTLAAPSGSPVQYLNALDFRLASGTAQNGIWQAVKKMPRYSAAGAWHISSVTLIDLASNQIAFNSNQLQAAGLNPALMVTSSPMDTTSPSLTSLTLTPPLFNTSVGSQTVNFTLGGADDLSGLSFSPTTTNCAFIQFGFTSPSGGQSVFVSPFSTPVNVGGTPLAGTWQFTAFWPQFSEEGTWTLSLFNLKDAVGNQVAYTPTMLGARGLPNSIVVTKPSLNVDGMVGPAGGTVTDNSFGSRASVGFPAGEVGSTTSVSIDVFPNPLPVPTPQGFTIPGTYFVNIAFTPPLSSPLPAPGITITLPLLTPMTPGAHVSLYHIDPVTGQLAPALDSSHNVVVGTVNADSVSATFLNVVTLSTVVAYLSNGSVLGDVDGNGSVSCNDVSLLKASFGKRTGQAGFNLAADLNNDGIVDIRDLFIVTRQLPAGTTCP